MNTGIVGAVSIPWLPRCRRGHFVTVRYAERRGEGEQADGSLGPSALFEAWINCRHCGWVSPLDERCWSEEVTDGETLTIEHRCQAVAGAVVVWLETREVAG